VYERRLPGGGDTLGGEEKKKNEITHANFRRNTTSGTSKNKIHTTHGKVRRKRRKCTRGTWTFLSPSTWI